MTSELRTDTPTAKDLHRLLRPRSVAIVGSSPVEADKLTSWPLRNLLQHRAPVTVYPVNPGHQEMDGLRCYPDLESLPEPPDVVLVMVAAERALAVLQSAESLGVGGAIVFGGGFERNAGLNGRLIDFVRSARLPVAGPNTNGLVNLVDRIPLGFAPFIADPDLPVGDVAVISQSGALVSAIVARLRQQRLGLSYSCAIGNAVDLHVGDYMRYIADDPSTSSVLCYVEGLSDHRGFVEGARRALEHGKLVVAMKGGRTDAGGAAVRSHTGALVGRYDAFAALCEDNGIVLVDDLESLVALPAVFPVAKKFRGQPRPRIAIVSGSGAVGCVLADAASEHGFEVPPLSAETREQLIGRLQLTQPENPLDYTAQVAADHELHPAVLTAFADDPMLELIVWGEVPGPASVIDRLKADVARVRADRDVPVVAYSAEGHRADGEELLHAAGVPLLPAADLLFRSLDRAFGVPVQAVTAPIARDDARARDTVDMLQSSRVDEVDLVEVLSRYGFPFVRQQIVRSLDELRAFATEVGGSVALKVVAPELPHKTDAGMVHLGLEGPSALASAYDHLHRCVEKLDLAEATLLAQQMVGNGVELIVGGYVDEECGPQVLVGAGGIFAEVLQDARLAPAPIDRAAALRLISDLRVCALLNGARGRSKLDIDAAAQAVAAMSQLIADGASVLSEVEVNPLIVTTDGAVGVDVLATRASRNPTKEPT